MYINDILLSRFKSPVICSNFCKAFSLKDEDCQYFFYTLWQHLYDKKIFFGYEGKTTGIKNLLFDSFISSYETIILSSSNMKKYNDLVIPIFNNIQSLLKENDNLVELRDWLLPMLMNGQVEVIE